VTTERAKERSSQNRRLIEKIEKKHRKSVAELYEERGRRIRDAIELRAPDRVPVVLGTGVFAARYGGLTARHRPGREGIVDKRDP